MNLRSVIQRIEAQGIRMIPNGDKLKLRGNIDSLSPEQMAWLKEHKAELLAALRAANDAEAMPDDWRQTPGGYWELWEGGRCVTVQTFHPETGDRCEYAPPAPNPLGRTAGKARIERLAQELGTDAGELLEWFADDLEHLARMR